MASSYRSLLATVKAELVVAKGASHSRIELFHALDKYLPDFQAFLIFPVSHLFPDSFRSPLMYVSPPYP